MIFWVKGRRRESSGSPLGTASRLWMVDGSHLSQPGKNRAGQIYVRCPQGGDWPTSILAPGIETLDLKQASYSGIGRRVMDSGAGP